MDPIFDDNKPIFVYMRCTYKQEWPNLTRIHLETDGYQNLSDGRIRRDESKLNLEFMNPNETPDIKIGDQFKITLKRLK